MKILQEVYGLKGGNCPEDFTAGEADQDKGERIESVANRQGASIRKDRHEDEKMADREVGMGSGSNKLDGDIKRMLAI